VSVPDLLDGTYETSDGRTIEYWTRCEHCPGRKSCDHSCETPGWIRFSWNGRPSVFISGIITIKKVQDTVAQYLESDPPEDVARPVEQMEMRFDDDST